MERLPKKASLLYIKGRPLTQVFLQDGFYLAVAAASGDADRASDSRMRKAASRSAI